MNTSYHVGLVSGEPGEDQLEGQLEKAEDALQNLITAIEAADGTLQTLSAAVARREAERDALERKINKTRSGLQPLLKPQPKLKDYVSGGASISNGDYSQDRATVERALESIQVRGDGIIVLHFRASLFGQVTYEVHGLEPTAGDLARLRDAMHFAQAKLTGLPKKVRDFGIGEVEISPDLADPRNTSGVPSGI